MGTFDLSGLLGGAYRFAALTAFLSVVFPSRVLCAAVRDDDYKITVRSSIEQKYTLFSKEPPRDHGRLYAIISLEDAKLSEAPLARPLNKAELLKQLRRNLSAYGFHESTPGKNPEIVLTILYGRGWLQNPYLDKTMVSPDGAAVGTGMSFGGVPTVTASVDQMIREKSTPGYEDKLQSAKSEKLFIVVSAWKFPATPTEKPVLFWRTIMITDDPDWDLNLVFEKMLEAGAANFDHAIDKEESTIWASKVADGHVTVGTPTVVEPKKTDK
jgi:hypothetical protein